MPTFDIYEELRSVVAAFEGRFLDYALCGAVALAVHVRPRATTGIDILVPADAVSTVKGILRGLGYDLEAAPMSLASGIRVHRVSRVADSEIMTVHILEPISPQGEPLTMPNHEADLDERLRELSRATAAWMSSEPGRRDMALRAKAARAQAHVDMGSPALDRRLRAMARAAALCLELAKLRHE